MRYSLYLMVLAIGCGKANDSTKESPPAKPMMKTFSRSGVKSPVPGGKVYGRESFCGIPPEKIDLWKTVEQSVDGFSIDTESVGCREWESCVASSACIRSAHDVCKNDKAMLSWSSAQAFCAASGGKLPSWAQWMRAIRGEEEELVLPWTGGPCPQDPHAGRATPCSLTSPFGVHFTLYNPNDGEWTGDTDCMVEPDSPLGVFLAGSRVGSPRFEAKALEFRCVVEDKN